MKAAGSEETRRASQILPGGGSSAADSRPPSSVSLGPADVGGGSLSQFGEPVEDRLVAGRAALCRAIRPPGKNSRMVR